jgi:hypothetical protein
MKLTPPAALCLFALTGCSSNDLDQEVLVNVAGSWGGTVRNESNSCPGQFNVGETTSIELLITQDGPKVSMKLQGGVGFLVSLALGTDTFQGMLTGDKLDASLIGSRELTEGTCKYSYTANLLGTVAGQRMTGTVIYKPNARSGDCSAIASCSRVQSFDVEKGKALVDAGIDAPIGG